MNLLVTGANGFLGKNLRVHLSEREGIQLLPITRESNLADLSAAALQADCVVHLAGINRPREGEQYSNNVELTMRLVAALKSSGGKAPVVYTSSTQVERGNEYGNSKLGAEQALANYAEETGAPVYVYRLPNVFGKWARPNYNSAVATFCHRIARDEPIEIHDPSAKVTLVYVDDVIESFLGAISGKLQAGFVDVHPTYDSTVGEIAAIIQSFKRCRTSLLSERVGGGLVRALYATYVAALPNEKFSYSVPEYADPRGKFVEMLKTPDCGQFSFFTAHPGITRGGHYHHTKTEKFLVIAGEARFKFRHMITGEHFEVTTSGARAEIVETIPGWAHDITNIGTSEMVVMLWANEIFDRERPDTYANPV
jgi:UDP-2-acetamido-2,6-beta-L-arabino-hexul-4-ose reductase